MNNSRWKIKYYIVLHIELLLLSLGGICSKIAAKKEFLSNEFLVFYGIVLLDLAVYAIVWQQIIKKLPLNTAYSNKAIMIVWGMIWGVIFFGEKITWNMIVGAIIVIVGVIMVVRSDENTDDKDTTGNVMEKLNE